MQVESTILHLIMVFSGKAKRECEEKWKNVLCGGFLF